MRDLLNALYPAAVWLHLIAGTVALATFWTAGLARKGGPLHRAAGRTYLVAMVAVIVSGVPMVGALLLRGHPMSASFLGYLLVLVSFSCWSAWRAVRDRRDPARYAGPVFRALALACTVAGLGMAALGLSRGVPLFVVFGALGPLAGLGAWRFLRRGSQPPQWWLREHLSAMIANGVATHIAFLGIGLRRLLPMLDGQALQMLSWFGPLAVALVAGWWLDRRYLRPAARRPATAHG